MSKYVLKRGKGGYSFHLEADNAEIIGNSEAYKALASAKKGIESIRRNADKCDIEDQTVEGYKIRTNPKFEIYRDGNKKYRFRMKAKNGQVVLLSPPCKDMDALKELITTVKKIAYRSKTEG